MDLEIIKDWIIANPYIAFIITIILSYLLYLLARFFLGRVLMSVAARTDTIYDDLMVENLHPFRFAWLIPLLMIYAFTDLAFGAESILKDIALFLVIWVIAYAVIMLLNGLNAIYEQRPSYSGVSIQGYLDIVKILIILVGIILSISLFTGESPIVLLSGLGALTAVLLLIFRDTILSLVASIQIASNELIKEGDWIEVPSYDADGDVLNMSLHNIKIQNWDKTITVIPTYKMIDVAYKNWRGMTDSGGRRIKRSLSIDMASIKFCDRKMLTELGKISLIDAFMADKLEVVDRYQKEFADQIDSPLDGPQITNVEIFRAYMAAYLRERDDIHQEELTFLIRSLAPGPTGLPIEVYVFTKTTDWIAYESIQAEIFDHFLAAASNFGLRVFQEPTGMDFASIRNAS